MAAILVIGESLDLDTVLREIVEGARGLTGARRGFVANTHGDKPTYTHHRVAGRRGASVDAVKAAGEGRSLNRRGVLMVAEVKQWGG